MARETKVGVLTGLAFIICFAIVLANRGASRTEPTVAHHQARTVHGVPTSALDSPSTQQPSQAGVVCPAVSTSSVARGAVPASQSLLIQHSPSDAASHHETSPKVIYSTGDSGPPRPVDASQTPVLQARDVNPAHTGHVNSPTSLPGFISAQVPPSVIPVRDVENTSLPTSRPSSAVRSDTVRYVVSPGETLWSLAARAYGKKSGALVQAIYEANRSVLSSPDSIKAGMALALPTVPGYGSPTGSNSPALVKVSEKASATPPPVPKSNSLARDGGRARSGDTSGALKSTPSQRTRQAEGIAATAEYSWYNVRKNDRLMGIAREQLGDPSRWEEIHALNKDKFPDPEKIREGVLIKLPVAKSDLRRNKGA